MTTAVVVDEVHHAHAKSYREILAALDPRFLLGLTATPDRADAADILGLLDDFVAYRADIAKGIEIERLVPFHYFGVKDDIEYKNLPWRNHRFDPAELSDAVQTQSRMQTLWRAWNEHRGQRTLVFCCSIEHANFTRKWLRDQGLRVNAVYAAPGSDDRDASLEKLASGDLDAVCAIDVFNEGIDVPSIDRVVMLRPTESSVVFLQQLGRGLRVHAGKDSVVVIDFVGNHSVFLDRLRTLLSFGAGNRVPNLREALTTPGVIELPAGCSVDLELDAKQLLMTALGSSPAVNEVERVYRELRDARDADDRPTAGELQTMGYVPSRLRQRHGSWFGFVRGEGDLDAAHVAAFDAAGAFLVEIETTEMTKSFKMATLQALLEAGLFFDGITLDDLAARSHAILRRSPEMFEDIVESERHADLTPARASRWAAYWRKNPIEAWTSSKPDRRTWFRVTADAPPRFVFELQIEPDLRAAFAAMVAELVEYRLAQYRARRRFGAASAEGFVCKVLSNQRDPILKLPPREGSNLPEREVDVRLPDGSVWLFRFAKEFCNVARPAGAQNNQLPDLLRRWFGPRAGQPGTAFAVRFRASPDGLWVEPERVAEVVPLRGVVAYPDLAAAAGHAVAEIEHAESERVFLPIGPDDPSLFAVRVAGDSMDGGKSPLRDGDWAVLRPARGAALASIKDRVVLVQVAGGGSGSRYQIKRLKRDGDNWVLASDNPNGPTITADRETIPIARLERGVHPEDLAPQTGMVIASDALAAAFGLDSIATTTSRQSGHLFVFIDTSGVLVEPDLVRHSGPRRRPGETAYVLARTDDARWRYLGVGRWVDGEDSWRIPDVDLATWRAWGDRARSVSRRLPDGSLVKTQRLIDGVLTIPAAERLLRRGGGTDVPIIGPATRGGVIIGGGERGLEERTITPTDLAWVLVANEVVTREGGLLDEARVNRVRYLEGTPKESTRWIDTGWAIAIWELAKARGIDFVGTTPALKRADGTRVDATFRVEQVGTELSIVMESRGTAGADAQRNRDYAEGLEMILSRIKAAGARIADARVESRETEKLAPADRRLVLTRPYPIAIDDPLVLRREMSAAQARVGRAPGAKGGGNQTKRIRIVVDAPAGSVGDVIRAISGS